MGFATYYFDISFSELLNKGLNKSMFAPLAAATDEK